MHKVKPQPVSVPVETLMGAGGEGRIMQMRKLVQICAVALLAASLSGCAAPIIAGITLSQISTVAGLISTAVTGKGLTDQALSFVTGKDCNLMESVLRKDRHLCEEHGSLATADDFKGIFVAFGGKDADPLQRYARARQLEVADATAQPAPVEPVAVEPASAVEPARHPHRHSRTRPARRLGACGRRRRLHHGADL